MKVKELKSILDNLDAEDNVKFVLQVRRWDGNLEEINLAYTSTCLAYNVDHEKIAQEIYLQEI